MLVCNAVRIGGIELQIHFKKQNRHGVNIFSAIETKSLSIVESNRRYYIRMTDDFDNWVYPDWKTSGFDSPDDAASFLSDMDWKSADVESISIDNDELWFIYDLLGIYYDEDTDSYRYHDDCIDIQASCDNPLSVNIKSNGRLRHKVFSSLDTMFKSIESAIISTGKHIFSSKKSTIRSLQKVTAAINTQNLASKLFRVKSSNVWAYRLFMRNRKDRTGDLIVQFKNKNGGGGDVYIYYEVPFTLFRSWQATQSKGHFFWKHIRNYFKYSKLTGDKIGKLPNAINHYSKDVVDTTPTCRYMLELVADYLNGKMSRDEFERDIPQYYNMAKEDMTSEYKRFTELFRRNIINSIKKNADYSDDSFKNVIRMKAKELGGMISNGTDMFNPSNKPQTEQPQTNNEQTNNEIAELENDAVQDIASSPDSGDTTPTCRYMLSLIADFIRGKINRDTLEKDVLQYYDIAKSDMEKEDRRFADVFRSKIIRQIKNNMSSSGYGNEALIRAILPDARYLSRRISFDDPLDNLSIQIDKSASESNDAKPTCRYMLELVSDFINGKTDRDSFEQDIQQYYNIAKPDMDKEDRKFSDLFRMKILNELRDDSDYSDKSLRNVLKSNVSQYLLNRLK